MTSGSVGRCRFQLIKILLSAEVVFGDMLFPFPLVDEEGLKSNFKDLGCVLVPGLAVG